ncbi:MAG TPA: hypothetical protein VNE38_00420 [Ktedonobacteraceae bacterium]|nr:hypothetical protein [Ktedonobacteraceae bacterium]
MIEPEQNENELEISDLPGTNSGHRVPAFLRVLASRPSLRSRLWQAGTTAIILCLLFVLLPGYLPLLQRNFSGIFAQSTRVPAPQASQQVDPRYIVPGYDANKVIIWAASTPPVVPVSATLDAAPRNCLHNTLTQNFDAPLYPAGVGGEPMWVTGFSGPRATLNHLIRAQQPQSGWYQQLTLVGETNFDGPVTLQGGVVGSTLPLWFGMYPHDTSMMLNIVVNPVNSSLSNHTTGDQQWGMLPINLYIARAGCYYLQASWNGGSWMVYFAAGR